MNMTFQQYEELAREIPNSHYGLSHYEKYLLSHILEMAKRGQELEIENRKFQECARELERQNDFFLKALKEDFMCPYSRCKYDDGSSELQEWECDVENNRECWIKASKEAENAD